jgi:predicted secreted acid phosphatase
MPLTWIGRVTWLCNIAATGRQGQAGRKAALVLDIDETALSNCDEEMQDDCGYVAKDWNDWVNKKQPTAIA